MAEPWIESTTCVSMKSVQLDKRVPGVSAPLFPNAALVRGGKRAGYSPGSDIVIMMDPAASEFYQSGAYPLRKSKRGERSSAKIIALWRQWKQQCPAICSLEDGIADHEGWVQVTKVLGPVMQIAGDGNFVTNLDIFSQGIADGIGNAILIKLYGTIISHRSGETDDTTIADLAVGTAAGQIKTGAPNRGERVAKYNRLLEIEKELGAEVRYTGARPYQRWSHTATP